MDEIERYLSRNAEDYATEISTEDYLAERQDAEQYSEQPEFRDENQVAEQVSEQAAERFEEQNTEVVPVPVYEETVERKRPFWKGVIAAALVLAIGGAPVGAAIGLGIGVGRSIVRTDKTAQPADEPQFAFVTAPPRPTPDTATTVTASMAEPSVNQPMSYAPIIAAVEPSVVTIVSTGMATSDARSFFGYAMPTEGAGSGILFHKDDERYYIVTNYHVVQSASAVQVAIGDAGPFDAKLIGKREGSDIAVISIAVGDVAAAGVTGVTLATFGDSDALRVGDMVLAIGNALGEGNTATNGIISAKNKKVTIDNMTYEALQTNAAINPGNSGGPLVNMYGEVVGINSAKLSGTAGGTSATVEGTGYSIPSNAVKTIVEELMGPPKPMLGIYGGTLTEQYADNLGIPALGVYISDVMAGYPAEKAGLMSGDVIVSFGGATVEAFSDLKEAIGGCKNGDDAAVDVIRDGEIVSLTVNMFIVEDTGF